MKPRSILIYGESGSTKTSQAYHLARYIHEKTGLRGRIIGSNASDSAPFEESGMIEKGIVDFFDISNRQTALADMRKLSEGYWPRDAVNPKTKATISKGYFLKEDACMTTPEQWSKIGFYIVEGLTGVSNLLLNHCRSQEEGVGFKHSVHYEEEGYHIGGLSEGHYGLIQIELYKILVQGFSTLPIKWNIWTALVGKGDDRVKATKYGPQAAGNKLTVQVPSWFMDTFHLDEIEKEVTNKAGEKVRVRKKVAWFVDHPDKDTDIPYLAKPRILPELYPELIKAFPYGYVELGFNEGLDKFFKVTDKIVEEYQKGKEVKKENAGG